HVVPNVLIAFKEIDLAVGPGNGSIDSISPHTGPGGSDRLRIAGIDFLRFHVISNIHRSLKNIGLPITPHQCGINAARPESWPVPIDCLWIAGAYLIGLY